MIKGFPSQSKLTGQKFNTVTPLGSDRHGIDVASKAIFPITGTSETPTAVNIILDTVTSKNQMHITFGAPHGLREGDVLRFDSGGLASVEAPVTDIPSTTTVVIPMILSNVLTSTCLFMRYVTLTLNSAGSLVTTSGPIEYLLDSVATQVEIDTATPANNKTLPTGIFFEKDGVQTQVIEDTGTPSNNAPLPVKMTSITGDINITANDLNVQTSHIGATPDSVRVGDGTNEMAVNASLEALVHDTDTLAELVLIDAKLPATLGSKADALSLAVTQSTEDKAVLAAMSAKLPASVGIKADAASLSVTQSTEDRVISNAIKTAVEASSADIDTVEDYYKRDFSSSPLTVVASWVTLRVLTASIKKIIVAQNGGNELLIKNATTGKEIIIGQGVGLEASLLGVATDIIEISALGSDATAGIIYVNFEG